MKKKARIVQRTYPDGSIVYVIQQRHWLLRWWWVPASANDWNIYDTKDTFSTFEEAEKNLCEFDGAKIIDKPVTKQADIVEQSVLTEQEVIENLRKEIKQ